MEKILYSSPYVPPELIEAHGFEPVRLVPSGTGEVTAVPQTEGVCAFMRMFCCSAADITDAVGIVMTSTCDQMRRGSDILMKTCPKPVFLMDVPAAWENASAHRYYRSELERLSRFLASIRDDPFSKDSLAEVMGNHSKRETVPENHHKGGIPLAVLGGPVAGPDRKLIDLLHQLGCNIVLNGLEHGDRTSPAPFDRRRLRDDPLGVLCDSYFGSIPDVFRRHNNAMYKWLERELAVCGARGLILLRYVWCDLWHAEVGRLRDWLKIPLIDIDLNGDDVIERNRTRLEAFLEGLQQSATTDHRPLTTGIRQRSVNKGETE